MERYSAPDGARGTNGPLPASGHEAYPPGGPAWNAAAWGRIQVDARMRPHPSSGGDVSVWTLDVWSPLTSVAGGSFRDHGSGGYGRRWTRGWVRACALASTLATGWTSVGAAGRPDWAPCHVNTASRPLGGLCTPLSVRSHRIAGNMSEPSTSIMDGSRLVKAIHGEKSPAPL